MTQPPELSVIIPAYREADNLRLLLPRLVRVLGSMGVRHEILVIDADPSKDETPDVCREWPVMRIPRAGGENYGDAVRTGIAKAEGLYILFMDADGSHAPEFIPTMWGVARTCDVVVASRYVSGGDTENPWSLIVMSRILNIVYSLMLGLDCRDVSNSFKLYRANLIKPLSLRCRHFDIVEELMVMARIHAGRIHIAEVPFLFKKRMFGETKRNVPLFVLSFYVTLLKLLYLRIWGGRR
jgi:dolichol-phosphate mannosyltransferase